MIGTQRAPGQQAAENFKIFVAAAPHGADDQRMQGAEDVDRLGCEGQRIVDWPGVERA